MVTRGIVSPYKKCHRRVPGADNGLIDLIVRNTQCFVHILVLCCRDVCMLYFVVFLNMISYLATHYLYVVWSASYIKITPDLFYLALSLH